MDFVDVRPNYDGRNFFVDSLVAEMMDRNCPDTSNEDCNTIEVRFSNGRKGLVSSYSPTKNGALYKSHHYAMKKYPELWEHAEGYTYRFFAGDAYAIFIGDIFYWLTMI